MRASIGTARPYARALHELARERGVVEAIGADLDTVAALLGGEPELRDVLGRPWVSAAAKAALARQVADRLDVSPLARDFLVLVARQGRADHLEAIVQIYRDLVDEDLGRVRARVRTPIALDDAERQGLRQRLGRVMGDRQVLLEEVVDPAMLGGFVAEIGSYIVDGSLDGQLARLGARLARGSG